MQPKIVTIVFLFLLSGVIDEMEASTTMSPVNLTKITWAHAVNSQNELIDVLNSNINFIEADIVMGTLDGDPSNQIIPIMGHPPANHSDISLEQFLHRIYEFNQKTTDKKGVKLDFKSIEVFTSALNMLTGLWELMDYPVWINADIIKGPVNNTETVPVDPVEFFKGCKKLHNAVLSIGWTTRWGKNFTTGSYQESHINDMIKAIQKSGISKTDHSITFPVRAGIAAQSLDNLHELCSVVNKTNNVTLTIWSSEHDFVDIHLLRRLIFSFGIDRVYIDVPEEVSSQLDLGNAPGRAASLIHFGIISIVMGLTSVLLSYNQF